MGFTYRRKLIENVEINSKSYIKTNWVKLLQRKLLNFKDPIGFSKTLFIKTTYFDILKTTK